MRKRMLWRPEDRKEMKRRLKPVVLMTALVLVLLLISCSSQPEKKAVIGIAWRSNQNAETFQAVCQAIESAGGVPVVLDQILSADLNYENGMLTEGKDADGCACQIEQVHIVKGTDQADGLCDIAGQK